MEKLLFIVPMHITMESFLNPGSNSRSYKKADGKDYNSLSTDLPLGPLSMSAYIKQFTDIEVKLVDYNVELNHVKEFPYTKFYDYCYDHLSKIDFKPTIVGVSSLFSPSFDNFMDCASVSKKIWPDALIIGGGNIPTNDYEYIYNTLNFNDFDALCYGEGEKPLKELLLSKNREEYLKNSKSWITKDKLKKEVEFKPKHDFIEDLDEIPFFDYDLCDIEKASVNPNITSFHNVAGDFGFHIMTSRGCPYLCTFCASHKTHGRKMRYHSVKRVREDLTRLKKFYGAKTVVFQDDHLMSSKERVYDLLDIVGDLGLGSLYQNGLTLYALDRPMLEAFYKAGVRHLVLPVESGSSKVLKHQMKKPLKFGISERVAIDCRDLGIYTNTNIIIGMPGETKQDLEDSRFNLRKIKTNWFNIGCASPLVGSEMHDLAQMNGYITDQTRGSDYHVATIKTEDFTPEYIQRFQYIMNLELNFIYNSDLEYEAYETGLIGFSNVTRIRPDHAFGHYFSSVCYKNLGDQENFEKSKENFIKYSKTKFWNDWLEFFNLPRKPEDFTFKMTDKPEIPETIGNSETNKVASLSLSAK
tara:strand:+ start:174 stop:1922 length:1749 start_codon:yes stop_codon:yes gene_type:complete